MVPSPVHQFMHWTVVGDWNWSFLKFDYWDLSSLDTLLMFFPFVMLSANVQHLLYLSSTVRGLSRFVSRYTYFHVLSPFLFVLVFLSLRLLAYLFFFQIHIIYNAFLWGKTGK